MNDGLIHENVANIINIMSLCKLKSAVLHNFNVNLSPHHRFTLLNLHLSVSHALICPGSVQQQPRAAFYQIFDRQASFRLIKFNKVICQSPNFKKLITVMTLAPKLCEAITHLARCLI